MKSVHNILFLLLFAGPLYANNHYWIYFHAKNEKAASNCWVSDFAVQQRIARGLPEQQISDLPVDVFNLKKLEQIGICVNQSSKWLNAAYAPLDDAQLNILLQLDFVKTIEKASHLIAHENYFSDERPRKNAKYFDALAQIKADQLLDKRFTGAGVRIGVVDAGFKGLDKEPSLQHLMANHKIKAFRDYHNPKNKNPYDAKASGMGNHGTQVIKNIGGYDQYKQYGMATHADFYLAFTDHDKTEKRIEEVYWVAAIEWFDSLGVRLVNSSLGYGDGFDDPTENYSPSDINGITAISRAAQIAAIEKGMLIVVSAGNDGRHPFQVISLPADAKDVLTVGATEFKTMLKMNYSSIGPATLSYNKPDVSCYSKNGTSFSAPIITGLAACIMQANPALSNIEVIEMIKKSSSLYPFANNYIGYGVPDSEKIVKLLAGIEIEKCKQIKRSELELNPLKLATEKQVALYHKLDANTVSREIRLKVKGMLSPILLQPTDKNIQQSTLASWNNCYEILWNE
jgi:subtilisin family serine protease